MGCVHRQLREVSADAVAVRIRVGEDASEQHLIGRSRDTGHKIRGGEGRLLNFGEEVLRVTIQHHAAHLDQRVIRVRPHLRQIEGVNAVGLRLLVGHDLHIERPGGVVATLDSLVQVAAVEVSILTRHLIGLSLGEELVALLGLEVVLNPEALAFGVNPLVGVRAEAVHVAQGSGQTAVAHQPGDLVRRCGVQAPEIPLHIVIAQTRTGHTFLRVDKVGELDGIANEEDRGVVAYQVVVAFGGVEFHRETAGVTPGVGGAGLARHG